MKRERKEKQVTELAGFFREQSSFYLLDYTRMTVAQSVEFRKLLRKNSFPVKVVKNRVALRALSHDVPAEIKGCFKKPTAIAFSSREPIALARLIRDYSQQNKILAVKGGVIEGRSFSSERFEEVCKLSSRKELLAKVGFLMAFPLMSMLRTWQAPLVNLGRLLSRLNNKKSVGG